MLTWRTPAAVMSRITVILPDTVAWRLFQLLVQVLKYGNSLFYHPQDQGVHVLWSVRCVRFRRSALHEGKAEAEPAASVSTVVAQPGRVQVSHWYRASSSKGTKRATTEPYEDEGLYITETDVLSLWAASRCCFTCPQNFLPAASGVCCCFHYTFHLPTDVIYALFVEYGVE